MERRKFRLRKLLAVAATATLTLAAAACSSEEESPTGTVPSSVALDGSEAPPSGDDAVNEFDDHYADDGHNHGPDDFHDHSADDGHVHGPGDGHVHGPDDGHNHDDSGYLPEATIDPGMAVTGSGTMTVNGKSYTPNVKCTRVQGHFVTVTAVEDERILVWMQAFTAGSVAFEVYTEDGYISTEGTWQPTLGTGTSSDVEFAFTEDSVKAEGTLRDGEDSAEIAVDVNC